MSPALGPRPLLASRSTQVPQRGPLVSSAMPPVAVPPVRRAVTRVPLTRPCRLSPRRATSVGPRAQRYPATSRGRAPCGCPGKGKAVRSATMPARCRPVSALLPWQRPRAQALPSAPSGRGQVWNGCRAAQRPR